MDYWFEALGGILIGIGSVIPLLYEGRIAGVSGYAGAAMRPKTDEGITGLFFVAGLIVTGFVWSQWGLFPIPEYEAMNLGFAAWLLAGLLVGLGSRLGGGCTSGHGVCGIGRVSGRSITAVVVFMGVAMITNVLMRMFL